MSTTKEFLEAYIAPALRNPQKAFCAGTYLYYPLKAPCVLRIELDTNYEFTEVRGFKIQLIHKINGVLDFAYISFQKDLDLEQSYHLRSDCWFNRRVFAIDTIINCKIKPLINGYLKVWGLLEEG